MKFSLIVPTTGRLEALEMLLQSLAVQTFQDFEVIVSDQSKDNRIQNALAKMHLPFKLCHIWSKGVGASKARNDGLTFTTGEIVTFPDDDCSYPPDLLSKVSIWFDENPGFGFLTGKSHTGGDEKLGQPSFIKSNGVVSRYLIDRQSIEFSIFIRRSQLADMRFDENMGTGCLTPWQAYEGPDLLLRLEESGAKGFYDKNFSIQHPAAFLQYHADAIRRGYRYACGNGFFLRKHNYPLWFVTYLQIRNFGGALLGIFKLDVDQSKYHLMRLAGRHRGFNSSL